MLILTLVSFGGEGFLGAGSFFANFTVPEDPFEEF
jgi:hypothetical protein